MTDEATRETESEKGKDDEQKIVLKDEPPVVTRHEITVGGLSLRRDFVDVRDIARAVHAAALSGAQGVINVGSGHAVKLYDAATVLARAAGFTGSVLTLDEPGGAGSDGCGAWQQADVRAARDRLGWRARTPLEESAADIWMEAACRV